MRSSESNAHQQCLVHAECSFWRFYDTRWVLTPSAEQGAAQRGERGAPDSPRVTGGMDRGSRGRNQKPKEEEWQLAKEEGESRG